ncbi:MAG: CsbD family protein [Planctomycetota bacterium]
MNNDIIKGKWQQLKGKVKARWGKLTDDDMTRIEGNAQQAAGRIQERYGIASDVAQREWDKFCKECEVAEKPAE